jgi:hypothetical protein
MSAELTKLSETRWRYSAGRRVFYLRQLKSPNEDRRELGIYQVDGGGDDLRCVLADSVEHLVEGLQQEQGSAAKAQATIPW